MLSLWQFSKSSVQSPLKVIVRYATKKASGSRTSNKDSAGRRLGSKLGEGEQCNAGQIIYRQRGTRFYPGENVGIGKDHTIFAKEPGFVRYYVDPFHPKRRFIGIALGKDERLPTPHFAPRRRRFGYVEIENEKWAEHEKNRMSRKESQISPLLKESFEKRESKRLEQVAKYEEELKSFITDSSFRFDLAAKRLVEISRYMIGGGRSYEESKALADTDFNQKINLDKEFERVSEKEADELLSQYTEVASKTDSAIVLTGTKIAQYFSTEEKAKNAAAVIEEIKKLVSDKEAPFSSELQKQIKTLLDVPYFSLAEQKALARRFIKREAPRRLSESFTLEDMKKLVKEKKGRIIPTWNYDARKVEKVFLPSGTPKSSIV